MSMKKLFFRWIIDCAKKASQSADLYYVPSKLHLDLGLTSRFKVRLVSLLYFQEDFCHYLSTAGSSDPFVCMERVHIAMMKESTKPFQ